MPLHFIDELMLLGLSGTFRFTSILRYDSNLWRAKSKELCWNLIINLDGSDTRGVKVIMATNRIESLDPVRSDQVKLIFANDGSNLFKIEFRFQT
jgi:ATP-dependent 26S proteasome regulatory subunit